jgi:putative flippase GtrA
VHLTALSAAMQAGVDFVPAQAGATLISIFSNFALNNALSPIAPHVCAAGAGCAAC